MASCDPSKPNIVLFLSDDQGAWALNCAGNSEIHTPNLDALAAQGIRFDNFFCTSPVCSPARASLLTGRIPSQHGVQDWIRGGNVPDATYGSAIEYLRGQTAYTDILARQGYVCGISGKWHLGDNLNPQKSFSSWYVTPRGGGTYLDGEMIRDGKFIRVPGYLTDAITDGAIEFLNHQATSPSPFYLSVHYTAPHSPWIDQHPPEIVKSYDDCPFYSCPQERLLPGTVYYDFHLSQQLAKRSPETIPVHEYLKGYFAAVTAMDLAVGRVLKRLGDLNFRENTLIIFLSDNGFNCGHHGIWGKGNVTSPLNMYDTSIKVPAIISHAGRIPSNVVSRAMVSGYDLMPTLLDYLGLQNPEAEKLPGHSFFNILRGSPIEPNDFVVVFDEYGPTRMIRTREWKYIHRYPYGPHELYDLVNDPYENINLLSDERGFGLERNRQDELIRTLHIELETWFDRYVDPRRDGARQPVTGRGQLGLVGLEGHGRTAFHDREHRKQVELHHFR